MSNESSGGLSGDGQSVSFDNFDIGGAEGGVNDIDLVLRQDNNVTHDCRARRTYPRNYLFGCY